MPRHSRGTTDSVVGGACKIRKRCFSSSSSPASSALLRKYRFKRTIVVGKRGGSSSTPVPTWKLNAGSPPSMASITESSQYHPSHISSRARQGPVSARKLATALWELNEIPPPHAADGQQPRRSTKEKRGRGREVRPGSRRQQLSDPSHSPGLETIARSRTSSYRRIMPLFQHRKQNHRATDFQSSASFMGVESHSQGRNSMLLVKGTRNCLKDLNNGLITSKLLLKLLNRIWGLKEKHSSGNSLGSALRAELDRACVMVDQLIQEQKSEQNEISYLKKQFVEEKAAWKSKEQENVASIVQSIMEELESEKKLRRRAERLNKNLGLELAKMKTSFAKAMRELECERRSREIIEHVCTELVRGVGVDKAEVEELKKESAKVREELEKEREMLQLADEWREERLQMKLSDAKFQYEEKNAAVDQLRNELEAFLTTKRTKEFEGECNSAGSKLEPEYPLQLVQSSKGCKAYDPIDGEREALGAVEDEEAGYGAEVDDGVNSVDSDLRSIELNMDTNNKNSIWSYATAVIEEGAKLDSVHEKETIRLANSEQVCRSSFYSDNERAISRTFEHLGDEPDQGLCSKSNNLLNQAHKLEHERYISVKKLRDRMLASSRLGLPRGSASPTR